ncbi:hypothetical protein EP47_09140 [Legionella norrlandica]|uniref:Flagellar biosynthetic protein FlhB n=1 Tax=Legionella norrlandica TaxID=1498499 RepID=A0A0A2T781_9GAMM|nr:EscU/YscU/HrcU family type III secretion system export apparatus switch protein [Legionella norrlandica]KGP63288.1 hypothetical protein EP47_09140 [Legionella norrlandica]
MSEKSEKPTPYKLQKAKERGQVSKSIELSTTTSLLIMLGIISALWSKEFIEIKRVSQKILYYAPYFQFTLDNISKLHTTVLQQIIILWLPLAIGGVLAIILVNWIQFGIVWSTVPLVPNFKRFNVVQGFKKIFSIKTCFEAIKNSFKLILMFIFFGVVFKTQLTHLTQFILIQPYLYPRLMMSFLLKLIFQLLLLLVILSIVDKFYSIWSFKKDNRMTKREIKEEYKQKEGDPKIKQKIKQLQYKLRQKTASLVQVKTADVVITNPTHLAIALKYERHSMPAPKVVCKAENDMAIQAKKLAKKYDIPIVENKAFAQLLFRTIELNQWISRDMFPVAADIFRDIYQQRKINEL